MLLWIDGVKLIDLYELQAAEFGLLNLSQTIFIKDFLSIIVLPLLQQVGYPFDEIFWCFPGWETDHSFWIFRNPFKEAQCRKQSKPWKIIDNNLWDLSLVFCHIHQATKVMFN